MHLVIELIFSCLFLVSVFFNVRSSIIFLQCNKCVINIQNRLNLKKVNKKKKFMKRRNFLIWSSIIGISPYVKAQNIDKEIEELRATFESVQEHLFPKGSLVPSASSMKLTQFLFDTMSHHSFDKDIREFVLNGAKKLDKRTKGKFITMNSQAKEEALRDFEDTKFGQNWLNRIIMLSMEGLFCDPIYGSNINQEGWRAIDTYGGNPRPQTKYLGL